MIANPRQPTNGGKPVRNRSVSQPKTLVEDELFSFLLASLDRILQAGCAHNAVQEDVSTVRGILYGLYDSRPGHMTREEMPFFSNCSTVCYFAWTLTHMKAAPPSSGT
jgi:hypothetical protein